MTHFYQCPFHPNEYSYNTYIKLCWFLCSIYGDGYPCFEVSAINADKPALTVSQIKDRVKQFEKVGESDCFFCSQAHLACMVPSLKVVRTKLF